MAYQTDVGFVQTKSSLIRREPSEEFKEVIFSSYKAKRRPQLPTGLCKKNKLPEPIPQRSDDDQRKFMKKARYEIIKFGMTGFDAAKKEETKQALAISLGAKPKKQKGINYKELKEKKKLELAKEKEKQAFQSLGKTATGHASAKIKKRMRGNRNKPKGDHKGGLLDVYGKVRKHQLDKK